MRLECLQDTFRKALSIVSRAANTKSTLPILANVLLQTDNGRLRLSCTNLEMSITTWVGAKVDVEGAVTLPAKLLSDTLAGLPNERVALNLDERGMAVNVACGRARATIKGIDSDEFPTIATHANAKHIATIQPDVLAQAIARTAFMTNPSRGALAGVGVSIAGDQITLRSSDTFRGGKHLTPANVNEPLDVIIPAPIIATVGTLFAGTESDVEIYYNDGAGLVLFHTENLDIAARLIAGTFPDLDRVFPTRHTTRAIVQSDELLRAVKLATNFTSGEFKPLRFTFATIEEGQAAITVASQIAEIGETSSIIDCQLAGDNTNITLNAVNISELVAACKTQQVAIELTTATNPAVIKPVGDDDYTIVIMPIFNR
jgi:DNA polymerase III subunit beta